MEMEKPDKSTLCRQLATVDGSLFFLVLITLSILLSFWSVRVQRNQLCLAIRGDTEGAAAVPSVYPLKHAASALVVGSLGFFLCLAIRALGEAEKGTDCAALRSARTNLWASLLVLAAAILRFDDLNFLEADRQSALLEADVLPD